MSINRVQFKNQLLENGINWTDNQIDEFILSQEDSNTKLRDVKSKHLYKILYRSSGLVAL